MLIVKIEHGNINSKRKKDKIYRPFRNQNIQMYLPPQGREKES